MTYLDPASEILRQITQQGYSPPTPQLSFAQTMQQSGLTGGVQPNVTPPVQAPSFLSGAARPSRQLAPSSFGGPPAPSLGGGTPPISTPGVAPTAANAGRLAGLTSRLAVNPEASGLARFAAPRFISEAGKLRLGAVAGRASLGVGAGSLGAALINRTLADSPARHPLANVAFGAGTGAALGSIVPGVGTAVGAGVGGAAGLGVALAGGLDNLFGGSGPKNEDDRELLNEAIATSNLSPEATEEILTVYNTLFSLARNDEEKAAAFETVKGLLVESVMGADEEEKQIETMLASQAMAQQFLSPITRGIVTSAEQQRDLMLDLANTLPPEFRGPSILAANQRVESANRIAGAYASQMQSIPQLNALQLEQQRQQTVAPDQTTAELQTLLAGLGAGG